MRDTRSDPRRRSGVEAGTAGQASPASLADPAPVSKTEVSSPRVRVPDVVPIGWLDRLLVAVIDLPLAQGERAVVDAILDAVACILPAYAVGVYLSPEGSAGSDAGRVSRRFPEGMGGVSDGSGDDPGRIFPRLPHEYVVPVVGVAGCSLHLASADLEIEPDSSPAAHLVDRAAMALGRAIPGARAARAATGGGGQSLDERMAHADKLATFGQIAAGVVHELNNPLTSIVAYSDYLIRRTPVGSDSGDLDRLRRISEAANRMLRFTRDLVSYARPSSGAAQAVILHDVINRAIAFCEHVLASSNVRVERRYGQDVRTVVGVTEQLVQVFVNLLTNACQAAPEHGGQVTITTRFDPSSARPILVVVGDNGGGVTAEHLPHVFAPFFTTKGDKQGTGLGLSIVRNIIEAHGGTIRVESPPGSGAQFTLELPATPAGPLAPPRR